MTESLLQKLEERSLMVLEVIDNLRLKDVNSQNEIQRLQMEIQRLSNEIELMNAEKENHAKKLHDLVLLLDVVNNPDINVPNPTQVLNTVKPILVQV